jgi:hypothetical protein
MMEPNSKSKQPFGPRGVQECNLEIAMGLSSCIEDGALLLLLYNN